MLHKGMSVYRGGFHNGFAFIFLRLDKVQIVLLISHKFIHPLISLAVVGSELYQMQHRGCQSQVWNLNNIRSKQAFTTPLFLRLSVTRN